MRMEAVKFQGPAAGGDFGIADEHADLFAQLVEEDEGGLGARDDGRQLAQRLAHQPGLQPHVAVAHVAFQFGLGHQCGHAVHDDDVDAARAHQDLGDLQRLFAPVGLGDVQFVDVHAEFLGVERIEGVLGVDEGGVAARFLGFGDGVQGQRRFARAFGAVDLDDPAARIAADAGDDVQGDAAGGNGRDLHHFLAAQFHDRALAELLFDLRYGVVQRGRLVGGFSHEILLRCYGLLYQE